MLKFRRYCLLSVSTWLLLLFIANYVPKSAASPCRPGYNNSFSGNCTECYGVGHPDGPLANASSIDSSNIHYFQGCMVVHGNVVLQHHVFIYYPRRNRFLSPIGYNQLSDAFENVTVITGYLQIGGWPKYYSSFSPFETLKRIEGKQLYENVSALYIDINETPPSTGLQWSLDLGLKSIDRGNVYIGYLYNLCHDRLINWNSILRNPIEHSDYNNGVSLQNNATAYASCGTPICDPQCTSDGCWGPYSSDCLACRGNSFQDQCVLQCPYDSSLYKTSDDDSNTQCRPCHEQCAGSCVGEGPRNCSYCRNFNITATNECVSKCPKDTFITYQYDRKCIPCFSNCLEPATNESLSSNICNVTCARIVANRLEREEYNKQLSDSIDVVTDLIFHRIFYSTIQYPTKYFEKRVINHVWIQEGPNNRPSVQLKQGHLSGISLPEAHGFYNVPYAKPPVGNLRFQQPQPVDDFKGGKFDASKIKRVECVQRDVDNSVKGQEDCLVLNIHVPKNVDLSDSTSPPSERLPVIFWIHGGGFLSGSGTLPLYDGRYLSNTTNTIVITANYRLGTLGFLVYDDGIDTVNGNQGIADQQLVLEWIQVNIERFGGDAQRVTIVGNNAGAQSILFHLQSKKSFPLFQRAILQSLPATVKYPNKEQALKKMWGVLRAVSCADLKCLREASLEKLIKMESALLERQHSRIYPSPVAKELDLQSMPILQIFTPILDEEEFTVDPIAYLKNVNWHDYGKKIIIGSNINEMSVVPAYLSRNISVKSATLLRFLTVFFGEDVGKKVAKRYGSYAVEKGFQSDLKPVLSKLLTEGLFECPLRAISRTISTTPSSEGLHLYSFAHAMGGQSCLDTWNMHPIEEYVESDSIGTGVIRQSSWLVPDVSPDLCGSVFHSSESIFLFRTAPLFEYNFSESDLQSANQFAYYWGNFAHSGNPSSGDVASVGNTPTQWPLYESTSQFSTNFDLRSKPSSPRKLTWPNLVIDFSSGSIDQNYKNDICNFWDKTEYFTIQETENY